MLILGLTGSIGMGKSVTARLFREAGLAVFDADGAVHELYRAQAVEPLRAAFPAAVKDGVVDRASLAGLVLGDTAALRRLEAIVHPLVRAARADFVRQARCRRDRVIVLDIPLLFETGADGGVDVVVVVSAPESVQKARVMARPGMTAERFAAILAQQLPDSEKRRRAHFRIDSSRSFTAAAAQVRGILRAVAAMPGLRAGAD